jgi:predicted SprT family Zn-dependent metalloprotease
MAKPRNPADQTLKRLVATPKGREVLKQAIRKTNERHAFLAQHDEFIQEAKAKGGLLVCECGRHGMHLKAIDPAQRAAQYLCPRCGSRVTVGVLP